MEALTPSGASEFREKILDIYRGFCIIILGLSLNKGLPAGLIAPFPAKLTGERKRFMMKQRRDTRQRQIVLETVRTRGDHPTADQIYLDVRAVDDRISRGTVYRNLSYLSEGGEVNHIRVPGADRYDRRTDSHYHLICTECGAVCDAPLDYDAEADALLAEKTGFEVDRHWTVFEGVCPACRKKKGSAH